ncbi:unnamed protein product [Calypogeia fissa]
MPNISSPPTMPLQLQEAAPPVLVVAQPEEVAQATRSNKGKAVVGASKGALENDTTMMSSDSEELTLVDVIPKRPRRGAARRVDSPEVEEQQEDHPEGPQPENNHVVEVEEEEEEEIERKPPIVEDGPNLPHYLQRVLRVDHHGSTRRLATALEGLMARAFCEEFIEGALITLRDHSAELFTYVRWLAHTVKEQRTQIKDLANQVRKQIANSDEYDQLVKEKNNWNSSKRQLEDELHDERLALEKVIRERDDGRITLANNVEVIRRNAQLFMTVNQERSSLQVIIAKVTADKQELNKTMLKLKSNISDLEKQMGEALEEKNDALQDMENSQDRMEAILQRIALLEARLDGPQDPLSKHQCNV